MPRRARMYIPGIPYLIRKAAHYCQSIGDDRFREQIESRYGVKLGQMSRGGRGSG